MRRGQAKPFQDWGLTGLLAKYPGLRVQPQVNGTLVLAGELYFNARYKRKVIADTYSIQIEVSDRFPVELPRVKEIGGRIPADFHHYSDGTLCLGSLIRLELYIRDDADLPSFVERFVVPYLFGYSHMAQFGSLPFGELEHGHKGIVQDLERILKATGEKACLDLLKLAGFERRTANRQRCPCGSGLRVGRCHNLILNEVRMRLGRLACRDWHNFIREHRLREKQQAVLCMGRRHAMPGNWNRQVQCSVANN